MKNVDGERYILGSATCQLFMSYVIIILNVIFSGIGKYARKMLYS